MGKTNKQIRKNILSFIAKKGDPYVAYNHLLLKRYDWGCGKESIRLELNRLIHKKELIAKSGFYRLPNAIDIAKWKINGEI